MVGSEDAQRRLVKLLRCAYSGELAAALAYRGHGRAVRGDERIEIQRIEAEEWEHRAAVGEMLSSLGASPSRWRDRCFRVIGSTLGFLCPVSGWFLPMYGAGMLERDNVEEYDVAARWAEEAGRSDLVPALLAMAQVERDHETYFRTKVASHWLSRLIRPWRAPACGAVERPAVQEQIGDGGGSPSVCGKPPEFVDARGSEETSVRGETHRRPLTPLPLRDR